MRIVVSGTHASGKSTLIAGFHSRHPEFVAYGDPFDELLDDSLRDLDVHLFAAQLEVSARRLIALPTYAQVIAERGPLDFLAYLDALESLTGRGLASATHASAYRRAQQAAAHIDLWVVLPLDPRNEIEVGDDEDPRLRYEMDAALCELSDDADLTGGRVLELFGDEHERLAQLETAVATWR